MVRRARENAVRASARYLDGLDVTPIARGKVDQTAAKRKKGRSNTDSSCRAIHTVRLVVNMCNAKNMPSHSFPVLTCGLTCIQTLESYLSVASG